MLTYADRLRGLRETKIKHTLAKRAQKGYMNADDYGTVPLDNDYHVSPYYTNRARNSFFGLEGMSENFVRVLSAHPPYVDPLEMLCGRWRDMLAGYRAVRWDEERFPYDALKPYHKLYNITSGIDNDSHCACDYSIGLALGFGGLMEKIRRFRQINPDKRAFYDAEALCLSAMIDFVGRHIEEIERQIETETRPKILQNLKEMLAVNRHVQHMPPRTFHEACQWVAYFNCCSRVYTRDGAGFQLDVLLYPYYEKDKRDGILNDEKAKFLIANLLLIDPHYYQISGVDAQDQDLTNPLSFLILDAADQINIAANLSVRVHDRCDPQLLRRAVYYLFKNKNGWPRFCGDESLTTGYMRCGFDKKTARERIAVGCNWMCVPGREFPMNDTVKINIAKVLEQALAEMEPLAEKSLDALIRLYEKHLTKAVEITAAGVNLHVDHQAEVTPELIMNLMMHGTLEKGEDISRCAQLYTIGVDGAGLAIAADSLAALSVRIEQEGRLSWEQLYHSLRSDFQGVQGERIRQMLNASPRYCQGGTIADQWARRLTDSFVSAVRAQPMPAGRQLVPGWFSWSRTIEYGAEVGAMPNGRRAGEPLSHGANPNPHFRTDGAVTAQASGIASVQCGYGNTAPLQLEFDPMITNMEQGVEVVTGLIRTHFANGGTLININILDHEKLMAAHENPDLYPDLVVRVTGFTAYFAALSPDFRQLVVDRFLVGA